MNLLFALPAGSEIVVLLYLALLSFEILYLVTLQHTMRAIHPENRLMSPGTVWVVLVPYLGAIFHFIVVFNLSGSIRKEARMRDIALHETRPGLLIGLLMLIAHCVIYIPALSLAAVLAFLVCQILFLIKMKQYKNLFANSHYAE